MLITKVEIAKYREVSRNVRTDKINPYIQEAELLDLKPLLGSALYFDLVNNKEEAKYVSLLKGDSYLVNNVPYAFVGIEQILSIFADARYKLFGSFTDTAFGLVEKSNTDTTAVSLDSKKDIYKKNRQTAYLYFSDLKRFLDANKELYPLWKKTEKTRGLSGLKISKIS